MMAGNESISKSETNSEQPPLDLPPYDDYHKIKFDRVDIEFAKIMRGIAASRAQQPQGFSPTDNPGPQSDPSNPPPTDPTSPTGPSRGDPSPGDPSLGDPSSADPSGTPPFGSPGGIDPSHDDDSRRPPDPSSDPSADPSTDPPDDPWRPQKPPFPQ